jgi:hypothetical protein
VWPKNTIFAVYSEKFHKFMILLKNGIQTPPPHGDTAADIAKMFAKNFSQKLDFG